ncbi:MAG: DUF4149 domain-containing protein [Pseudomonadota bacterium]
MQVVGWWALGALFGAMVFFPAVVAPRVFRALDGESAGNFLRALFPGYYLFMIVSAAIAAVCFHARVAVAFGLLTVALSTLLVRQLLVPLINAARDAQLAGDTQAGARFQRGHRVSVVINMAQLIFVAWAVARLALTGG